MSQAGGMSAICATNSINQNYIRFFYDTGSSYNQKYVSSAIKFTTVALSANGSHFGYLEWPSGTFNIIIRNYTLGLYANITTGISIGSYYNYFFITKGSVDYFYLILRNSSVLIYMDTGNSYTLFDTVNMALGDTANLWFANGNSYFYSSTPGVNVSTYPYVYCNVANCQTCSTPGQCGQCLLGYALSGNTCLTSSKTLTTQQPTDAHSSTFISTIIIGVVAIAFLVGLVLLLIKVKKSLALKQTKNEPKVTEFNEINNDSKVGQDLLEKTIQ